MAAWWPRVLVFVARLPERLRRSSLPELLVGLTPADATARPRLSPAEMARVIWNVLRWNRGRFNNGCFVRSFTRYHHFRRLGCPVVFHLGVEMRDQATPRLTGPWNETEWTRLRSHAWLTLDGEPFLEFEPARFAEYRELFRWPADPVARGVPGPAPGGGNR